MFVTVCVAGTAEQQRSIRFSQRATSETDRELLAGFKTAAIRANRQKKSITEFRPTVSTDELSNEQADNSCELGMVSKSLNNAPPEA